MEKLKSFVFCESFYENIRHIKSDKMKCDVLCSIIEYGLYGTPIDVSKWDETGVLTSVVVNIKNLIDKSKANRQRIIEIRRENGKKGGGQTGNQNARKYSRSEVEENDADDEHDTDEDLKKNEQKRVKRVKRVVDVDVDVDVDENYKKNISCDISEKAERKTDEVEIIQPPKRLTVDHNKVVAMWNEICTSNPKVMKLTTKRKQKISQRMKELGDDYEAMRTVFEKVEHSEFMRGAPWATFDWVMDSEDHIVRIQENQLQHKSRPKTFAANNNVNDLWREREVRIREMQYHPNKSWEEVNFNPADFATN